MTREEAIEILSNTSFFGRSTDDIDTALDMAIKALSVPEVEYINKAELIKRMLGHINRFAEEKNFAMNEGLKYAQGVIVGMPTFTVPEREKGEWIPVSSVEEMPKEALWVTRKGTDYDYVELIGWDSQRNCRTEDGNFRCNRLKDIVAYMLYSEPEPYKEGGKE